MILSVIIPIYNGAKFVEKLVENIETVNAVLEKQIEILLINDGSTDNSSELCQQMVSKYANVNAFNKKNGGISSARNVGLANAHGKYVTFCDQDDIVVHGYAPFIKILQDNECDILIANNATQNQDGHEQHMGELITENEICDKEKINYLVRLLSGGTYCYEGNNLNQYFSNFPPTVWNCLFRKDVIDRNGIHFRSFVDYEDDWIFLIDNLLGSEKIFLSKDHFYCWTVNPESESHSHKYIPDLCVKLKPLMDYHCDVLRKAGTPEDKIRFVKSSRKRNAILSVFFNEMDSSYSKTKKEVQTAISVYYEPGYSKLHKSTLRRRVENAFIAMFHYHLYLIPYIINKYIVKFSFH